LPSASGSPGAGPKSSSRWRSFCGQRSITF
jgi:hypothetical protein